MFLDWDLILICRMSYLKIVSFVSLSLFHYSGQTTVNIVVVNTKVLQKPVTFFSVSWFKSSSPPILLFPYSSSVNSCNKFFLFFYLHCINSVLLGHIYNYFFPNDSSASQGFLLFFSKIFHPSHTNLPLCGLSVARRLVLTPHESSWP